MTDQPITGPLTTLAVKITEKIMPQLSFKPMIPVLEQQKIVQALQQSAYPSIYAACPCG
jgi:hypothetical protein